MNNYSYPLLSGLSNEEISILIDLWVAVEEAYEDQIRAEKFLERYQAFKRIVPSKMEEKQLGKEFEERSGYSLYQVVQLANTADSKSVLHVD